MKPAMTIRSVAAGIVMTVGFLIEQWSRKDGPAMVRNRRDWLSMIDELLPYSSRLAAEQGSSAPPNSSTRIDPHKGGTSQA
jgi:hypothetical protein